MSTIDWTPVVHGNDGTRALSNEIRRYNRVPVLNRDHEPWISWYLPFVDHFVLSRGGRFRYRSASPF